MTVFYDALFFDKLKKLDIRIRKSVKERLLIFSKDPYNPQLNNHMLKREYIGYSSIDITADYRALYKERKIKGERIAYFVLLGTHKELYG